MEAKISSWQTIPNEGQMVGSLPSALNLIAAGKA
jgi:hypothetical protein